MKRSSLLLLICVAVAACDELLEEPADPLAYLRLGWPSPEVVVAQGAEQGVTVTIQRYDGYSRSVGLSVQQLPTGVTAKVTASTAGDVITAVATLSVAPTVPLGSYKFMLRVRGERLRDAERQITLRVVEPPRYTMTAGAPELRVVRGGVAPLSISLERTNFPTAVTLSLQGPPGISAVFPTNPVTANRADAMISAAADMAPGTYPVTIRGVAPPFADRSAALSVVVSADHLQVIVDTTVSAFQGKTTRKSIIVNRSASATGVAVTAENLPSGVTASFEAGTSPEYVMGLAVLPNVATGSYPVTIRATASGVPDATASFTLAVARSTISLKVDPESLSVFQGTSGSAALSIQRTALDTSVTITVEGAPTGLTVTPTPASTSGTTASLAIAATSSLAAASYDVTVVALPAGWPSNAAIRAPLRINVREVPAGGGNVILDWSRCVAPVWVATQDGGSAWRRATPVSGVVRFNVASLRGGFAFVGGDSLTVQFMSQAELTSTPRDMCPPVAHTKQVTGRGVHAVASDLATYALGGATALSTGSIPDFVLIGVRPGVHDLVAWTQSSGVRGVLRRDLDIDDGGSLGLVDFSGSESFLAMRPNLTQGGLLVANETVSHSMSYLSTSACTANPMYTTGPTSRTAAMFGVPETLQRNGDFHLVTGTATLTNRTRTVTMAFRRMETRTLAYDQGVNSPFITSLGGSYRRLQASAGVVPPVYNGTAELRYVGGGRQAIVGVTKAWFQGASTTVVAMPDLRTVDGWVDSFAPPADAIGSWTFTLEGSTGEQQCTDTYRRVTSRHVGAY